MKEKENTFTVRSVSKLGCVADNKLAPSGLPLQMLRLGFNCGTWVGKRGGVIDKIATLVSVDVL